MEHVASNSQIPPYSLIKGWLLASIICWATPAFTQDCKSRYEKEVQPLLRANQLVAALEPTKLLAEKCPDFYPVQATLSDLFWETGDSLAALLSAKALIVKFPKEKRPYQQLVRKLAESAQYKEAVAVISQFEELFKDYAADPNWVKRTQQVKWAAAQPRTNQVKSLTSFPESVNTIYDEGLACMSPLENQLMFTRRSGNIEKLMLAERIGLESWKTSEVVIPEAGTRIGAHTFSANGSMLIFTACDRPDSRGRCDLYESIRQKDGTWSEPQNLGNTINSPSWESQPCLSFDGKVLIFSSTREGGKGGSDLWLSNFMDDRWSIPVNLSELNTPGDEKSPFLHSDGRTLFFASNGRVESFGMLDLYVAHFEANKKKWTEPLNLGAHVNSPFNESGFTINTRGNRGFINRFQPGKGEDLFEIGIDSQWNVPSMSLVQLKGALISTPSFSWSLVDLYNGQYLTDQWIKSSDSSILVVFDVKTPHALLGKAPGFLPISINLSDTASSIDTKLIVPEKIEPGKFLTLTNIFFETSSFHLNPKSETELDFIADWMKENKEWSFEISGHTDNVGKANDNKILSLKRAEVVKMGLVQRGIPASRLKCMGYGSQAPIARNETESGRAKNRRTVLKVLNKIP